MQAKVLEPVVSVKGKGGWLGAKQPETKPAVTTEFKLSGWAAKGIESGDVKADVVAPAKFAPLEKSQQEKRFERQEQEYVFVSKKEQEERRLKRE